MTNALLHDSVDQGLSLSDIDKELIGDVPDLSPLETVRHSCAHIMAIAVQKLFPETKVTIGPSTDVGFYYDFDTPQTFTAEDLTRIEAEMKAIIAADIPFVRESISRDEALKLFADMDEPYKIEIIKAIETQTELTVYKTGDWLDLCRGPHVESSGKIKAFKLLSVAGAYWRGDENKQMLQRIYGTAHIDKKQLKIQLQQIEEAKKRDHRKLGKALDLFSIDPTIGGGLVLWHPKGARIRYLIEEFWRKAHYDNGYELVSSPHVARDELWKTSGHLEFYQENMYSGMDVDGQQYLVKPMNCPFHVSIYKQGLYSYRNLPCRWAELGTVYRYERSGVLHGLLRVRGFTQDDAHIFMAIEQLADELAKTVTFCLKMLRVFGFEDFKLCLATRPEKFVGDTELWDKAETALYDVLKQSNIAYDVDHGGGAFYGPKIDIKLFDSLGREWQCSTIQVDFNLPERFNLLYAAQDGSRQRIVMVHRALLGSIERFFAILVEHYAGAFPTWLAPIQARIITVSEKQEQWATTVLEALKKKNVRAEVDFSADKLGAKIRRAQMEKIPNMIICGDKEVSTQTVSLRKRTGEQLNAQPLDDLINTIVEASCFPVL